MTLRNIVWVGLLAVLAMACQSAGQMDTPPQIRYGEDICDQCRMIISEARFAAAYVTHTGQVRRFDDIGDMLLYHAAHQEDVAIFWVHDFETEDWLQADEAFFVTSQDLPTPMGHGVVAFSDEDRADELAAETQGMVLTFDDLLAQSPAGEAMPDHMHRQQVETKGSDAQQ